MVINYLEAVSLLTWGFFLDDNNDKIKFNEILGENLSEKISDFENEQAYLIIKKDAVDSFIETINKSNKMYGNIKEFGDILFGSRSSSHTNSDVVVLISLNNITDLSKMTIERKKENFSNENIYKRMESDMIELESLSTELKKMGGFSIPELKIKEVVKMINKNNLMEVDIKLFNKLKEQLNERNKNQPRKIKP